MLYCLIEDDELAEGPCELPASWRHISGLSHLAPEELAVLGWFSATVTEAEFEPLTQKLGEAEVTISAAGVSINYPPIALSSLEATTKLKAYAAQKRFEIETGGITLNGVEVATDRESQGLINGAYNAVQLDPNSVIKWKGINGFVDLNAAAMTAIAAAVAEHVQTCFAAEAAVVAAIDAGTIASKAAIDAAGWPA